MLPAAVVAVDVASVEGCAASAGAPSAGAVPSAGCRRRVAGRRARGSRGLPRGLAAALGQGQAPEPDAGAFRDRVDLDQHRGRVGLLGGRLAQHHHAPVVLGELLAGLLGEGDRLLLLGDLGLERGDVLAELARLLALGRQHEEVEGGQEPDQEQPGDDGSVGGLHLSLPEPRWLPAARPLSARPWCRRSPRWPAGRAGAGAGTPGETVAVSGVGTASKATTISNW